MTRGRKKVKYGSIRSFNLSNETIAKLVKMTANPKRSQSQFIEELINNKFNSLIINSNEGFDVDKTLEEATKGELIIN